MGTGSGTREVGTGLGRGLSSSPRRPSPNHPTDSGREARRRSHKYVQNSEEAEGGGAGSQRGGRGRPGPPLSGGPGSLGGRGGPGGSPGLRPCLRK